MGFMRSKTTGFTAVFAKPEQTWKMFFLREDQAALIDTQALQWQGPLSAAFNGAFAALPEPFLSCSDGAFDLRANDGSRTLFLAGDQCLEWHWSQGRKYQGLITGFPRLGPYIPSTFRSDVDIAMQLPSVGAVFRTLLIKGDQCALIEWDKGVAYQGPLSGMKEAGWKKLPEQMSGDFDHAVLFYRTGSNIQTLFIKGDQAMLFDWVTGPTAVGTYAQVMAGLGALPADYQEPRLPAAGRFSGITDGVRVDLRIDLEGALPVVSGDTFSVPAGVYLNSFVLEGDRPVLLPVPSDAPIAGIARWAVPIETPKISVTVDKLAPGGTATLTSGTADDASLTRFGCAYVSRFLRTVDWEIDFVAGAVPFTQYATTDNPRPDLAKKVMTVQSAFAEAGIELRTSGISNVIPLDLAYDDARWSAAELHAAMEKHFSGYLDAPQWKLWTFVANLDADGDFNGSSFDLKGRHRQGVVMFYDALVKNNLIGTRDGLRSWVHETGHAFNLMHSWEKQLGNPPQQPGERGGHGDLSFMNYPHKYQSAALEDEGLERIAAYWNAFAFQFTPNELRHLRHGFYLDVVMGGNDSDVGGADQSWADALAQSQAGQAGTSGLRLEMSGRGTYLHGEPVVAEIKLSLDGSKPQAEAAADLSPQGGNLAVLITDPAGATRPFRPIVTKCGAQPHTVTLDATTPALYDSAYLGYGANGFTFTEPGTYRLTALYKAPDGTTVTSPDRTIEITAPASDDDRQAGDLLTGSQQGTLLAFLGSDAPQLAEGNAALDTLIANHPDHPLTVYARMVKGANAGRHFLTLTTDGIQVRATDTNTSIAQLAAVVQTTLDPGTDAGVDNITLNETMRRLARAHARAGDLKQADIVLDQLVDTFRDKHVPAPVLATIVEQAETARAQLHAPPAPAA
jgi:hypothetical protein